jgi:UDP-N-acetylglucosamine 2-epimerase (non-hydrolysing)
VPVKVMTVLGTRPEIIRLGPSIERLDAACHHVLVHTGQNFTPELSDVFFEELGVRRPDHHLGVRGERWGQRLGELLRATEEVLLAERPDRLVILGDTDGGLCAIVAKRMGVPVFHLEAGNRCFDDRVPEEVNRRVIDHASDVLLPYTARSRENLLREGVPAERVLVSGNPIREVLLRHAARIEASDVLARLGLCPRGYLLLTAHRQETVDVPERLRKLTAAVAAVSREHELPVVFPVHPRTRDRLTAAGVELDRTWRTAPPLGFADFVHLERHARCVLTDSGTVQEECCLLGVPAVTLRDTTERPETVECGSNVLAGVEPEAVLRAARLALGGEPWTVPAEYLVGQASRAIAAIVLGPLPREARRSAG